MTGRNVSRFGPAISLVAIVAAAFGARGGAITLVHQAHRAFTIAAIQVARGDVVQFSNDDTFDHQIAIDAPGFKFESPGQPPGSVTAVTFSETGSFEVHCEIHPRMHMTVTVR